MGERLSSNQLDKAKHVARCLELAILYEISADKPGNVNLTVGFEGTRYEHFLASAVATAPYFELAAERGIAVSRGELKVSDVNVGRMIRDCVAEVEAWQNGGNTLLGTIILLMPLAVAAGMTPTEEKVLLDLSKLRKNLRLVVEATTPEDAVFVYDAIRIANPSGLNKAPDLDVNNPASTERILNEKISLYEVFKIASTYDNVCSEWTSNYQIIFDFVYPNLVEQIKETESLNKAVVHTFLKVLAEHPDTFIARKVGVGKARDVSIQAEEVLKLGGLATEEGKEKLREFDSMLRKSDSLLNPGTTADLVATGLALLVLGGYKP